jgi:hypothetical protein
VLPAKTTELVTICAPKNRQQIALLTKTIVMVTV